MSDGCVLLIEDNPDDVALTLRAFLQSNIANEVVVANDGVEALEILLPDDGSPGLQTAVILLDLNLPRVNGFDVLRRLREDPRTHLRPVVVLTSSDEDRDRVESYSLGANSYVRKPVDFAEFVKAARVLGLYWVLLNKTP